MRHTILFTRTDEGRITEAATLYFWTENPSAGSHEEAFSRFRQAVADWLSETQEGRLAWVKSEYTFNIGDFSYLSTACRPSQAMYEIMHRHGIVIYSLQPVVFQHQVPYDTVLGDDWNTHKKDEKP